MRDTGKTPRVLIVEDDADINRLLYKILKKNGYAPEQAFSGTEARLLLQAGVYDLLLLDLMLPGMTGEELLDYIRRERRLSIPVVILSAKGSLHDRVELLMDGADDYLTKPFSISILKIRLEKALRKQMTQLSSKTNIRKPELQSGSISLSPTNARAYLNEKELELSLTEFRLLQYFLENKNQVLLKEQILQHIWDNDSNFVEENTLSVNISRLRKKIGDNHIKTIYGMGYLWEE